MRRRNFLVGLALTGAAGCATTVVTAPERLPERRAVERVGLQLYTVRDLMAQDIGAALSAVAQAGYVEVETAGTGSLTPVQFAQALADVGLTAPSAHVPLNFLIEQPDSVLAAAQSVGYQYIVVPWLPPEMRTLAGYGQVADALNRFGELSAREGIRTGYHNHDFEFANLGDVIPMKFLLDECDSSLVRFELDLFWVAHAGADAADYLSADPSRYPLCHIKDRDSQGKMVDVGAGEIDFPALFSVGTGLQHYFVEHDRPENSLLSVQNSIAAVQTMRF